MYELKSGSKVEVKKLDITDQVSSNLKIRDTGIVKGRYGFKNANESENCYMIDFGPNFVFTKEDYPWKDAGNGLWIMERNQLKQIKE